MNAIPRRLITVPVALLATLLLAACGGAGGGDSSDSATTTTPRSSTTIATKQVDGIGRVLVAASGKALYSSDVEADGKVRCTGGCTSFWEPLTIGSSAPPTAPASAGMLGLIRRPDGAKQVALDGKPLYTFAEDPPDEVTGNGFSDDFNGRHFTWTAVLAGGGSAGASGGASTAPRGNDSGY
jgi:predicted lipoprotein with Yx(FWY)xxD motif